MAKSPQVKTYKKGQYLDFCVNYIDVTIKGKSVSALLLCSVSRLSSGGRDLSSPRRWNRRVYNLQLPSPVYHLLAHVTAMIPASGPSHFICPAVRNMCVWYFGITRLQCWFTVSSCIFIDKLLSVLFLLLCTLSGRHFSTNRQSINTYWILNMSTSGISHLLKFSGFSSRIQIHIVYFHAVIQIEINNHRYWKWFCN